jgi:hypothetical protein
VVGDVVARCTTVVGQESPACHEAARGDSRGSRRGSSLSLAGAQGFTNATRWRTAPSSTFSPSLHNRWWPCRLAETLAEESMVSSDKSCKQLFEDALWRWSHTTTDMHRDVDDAHSGPREEARHLQPPLRVLAA